jgi:hypothetical protein
MEYPWLDKFVFEAQEDAPPDEETGTNEPVDVPAEEETNPEEEPSPELAKDLTEGDVLPDEATPTDTGVDTSGLQSQIDDLKKQLEEVQKSFNLEERLEDLKRRLENVSVPDSTDMNDSIFQSASSEIKYIKRAMRRFFIDKKAKLSGNQRQVIESVLEQKPEMTSQEIAAQLATTINASEQDIVDFIRNSEFRFRHRRHGIEASVIDWESFD